MKFYSMFGVPHSTRMFENVHLDPDKCEIPIIKKFGLFYSQLTRCENENNPMCLTLENHLSLIIQNYNQIIFSVFHFDQELFSYARLIRTANTLWGEMFAL